MQFIYLMVVVQVVTCQTKLKMTIDHFFNNTDFQLVSFSPTGQHLMIQTRQASWDTNSFELSLWLYDTKKIEMKKITNKLSTFSKPQWSPSGNRIGFLLKENTVEHFIYFYEINSTKLVNITIGKYIPLGLTWGADDCSLFFTTFQFDSSNTDEDQWKDVIRPRLMQTRQRTMIFRIDINQNGKDLTFIKNLPFFIGELLYSPIQYKLILTSVARTIERIDAIEIYSIDVRNSTIFSRLTQNEAIEQDLKLSRDGRYLLFRLFTIGSNRNEFTETYDRLFSLDLSNSKIKNLSKGFSGSITSYAIKPDNNILILGQVGTEIQIYELNSSYDSITPHPGLSGSYSLITIASETGAVAFVHSAFEKVKEIYFVETIDKLKTAKAITKFNQALADCDLPQGKIYRWINEDDNRTIEGVLRYPPGHSNEKMLPLLVLIHGGLYTASVNGFQIDWENWGILAASEGWLVFEPNYRGSTGYGIEFINEVRYQFLSRPTKDILSGVDQLIKDEIADPTRLAIGGYSYGGYLTNWIITQTTQFNAALSGAGAVEHSSEWGTIDLPIFEYYVLGGTPWESMRTYQDQAAIYQLHKVRTPTHIVTGQDDVRVNPNQSYMFERALNYLGVPVQLLVFPNEDHSISNNPWHGKIKVREELKWLQKYGHQSHR